MATPKVSAPIATNVGHAPAKAVDSQTLSFGSDGSAQPAEPLKVTKSDIKALGDPQQMVKAAPGALPKSGGSKVVVTFADDGDTFRWRPTNPNAPVPNANDSFKCRFDSIDAPEVKHGDNKPGQAYGPEAAAILQKMIVNKQVNLTVTGQDKYGRNLCQVEIEGKGVDVEMVKAGAAWLYKNYVRPDDPRRSALESAQSAAQANGAGLWAQPNPVAPWSFRQSMPR